MSKNKKRVLYGALFLAFLLVEVYIALYVHDNIVRPYLGDILVVIAVYLFMRMIIPEGVKYMILYVFIFAVFVEILQYFKLVKVLGLSNNTFARIILGSTFDVKDILCYAAGSLILLISAKFIKYRKHI